MGSSGGSQNYTNSAPWSGAQPYLTGIMGEGSRLYQDRVGSGIYSGPTQAAIDPTLAQAMGYTTSIAQNMMGNAGTFQPGGSSPAGGMPSYQGGISATGMPSPQGGISATGINASSAPNPWDVKSGMGDPGGPGPSPQGGIPAGTAATNANLPYQNALGMIQSNGITTPMQTPLNQLGAIANGQNGITTGNAYGQIAQNASGIPGISDPSQIDTSAYGALANRAQNMPGVSTPNQIDTWSDYRSLRQNLPPNASAGLTDLAQNGGMTTRGLYNDQISATGLPTSAQQNLTDMAKGQTGANPYLQSIIDAQADRISNRVNSTMSGMGRYGSGGHTDVLARSLADSANPILAQDYENARQRQLAATGQIDAARQAQQGLALSGLAGASGVDAQSAAQRMGAAGQIDAATQAQNAQRMAALAGESGIQGQNISNAMDAQTRNAQLGMTGNQLALGALSAGSGFQGQNISNLMNAQRGNADIGLARNNLALNALGGQSNVQGQNINNQMGAATSQLGQYNTAGGQAANWASMLPQLNDLQYDPARRLGSVGDFNQSRAQNNLQAEINRFYETQQLPWQQLSRFSSAVSGLGGMIPATGQMSQGIQAQTPWTQYAGLGIGGLGAASSFLPFLLSDERAKTDKTKIGKSEATGLDIYSYRYKGDPKTYPKMVGPMAQDVQKKYPDAVVNVGGLLAIKPQAAGLLGM